MKLLSVLRRRPPASESVISSTETGTYHAPFKCLEFDLVQMAEHAWLNAKKNDYYFVYSEVVFVMRKGGRIIEISNDHGSLNETQTIIADQNLPVMLAYIEHLNHNVTR